MAALVARGWAGAVIEKITEAFGQEQMCSVDQPTDLPTYQRTDKAGIESHGTQLKAVNYFTALLIWCFPCYFFPFSL